MAEINVPELIYIWCGILSGLWVILAICLIVLCVRVGKIGRLPNHRASVFMQNPKAMSTKANSVYSYGSPAIVPGEDLARRGYSAHAQSNGKKDFLDDTAYFASDFARPGVASPPPRLPTAPMSPQGRNNANFVY